jgi:hypothetical protein
VRRSSPQIKTGRAVTEALSARGKVFARASAPTAVPTGRQRSVAFPPLPKIRCSEIEKKVAQKIRVSNRSISGCRRPFAELLAGSGMGTEQPTLGREA